MSSSSRTILFLGATGAGKTSLINRLVVKPLNQTYIPTIGYSIEKGSIIQQATQYHLTLIEISCSPHQLSCLQQSPLSDYKFDLAIIVYDVGDKASKLMMEEYLKELEEKNYIGNLRFFIIANKMDENVVLEQSSTYPFENIEYLSVFDYSLNIEEICHKIWDKARYFDAKPFQIFQKAYQNKAKAFITAAPTSIRKFVGGFPQFHKKIKMICLGSQNVGKSSIIAHFNDQQPNENYIPTIGVDFKVMPILYNEQICNLQFWDTSGQQKFKNIISCYIKTSEIFFFVYDVSNKSSLEYLHTYIEEIKYLMPSFKQILCVLIGNKCDKQRSVSYQEGQLFAKSKGMNFFEISAKTKQGLFESILTSIEAFLSQSNLKK